MKDEETWQERKVVTGDLLDIQYGIIVHQVNCQGVMGAGLAKQIRQKWPAAYLEYRSAYNINKKTPARLLGNYVITQVDKGLFVLSAFCQYSYGEGKVHTDITAWKGVLPALQQFSDPLFMPWKIGCGLAGGDWSVIQPLIESYLPDITWVKKV